LLYHAVPAGGELAEKEAHAQELVDQVQELQQALEKSTTAAHLQAEEAATQHRALQQQLVEQQAQLEQDREAIESLQEQAQVAKRELALQQQLAEGLQEQSVVLQEQLQSTAAAKMAAEAKAHHLAEQLTEAQEEMSVLQHAQVRNAKLIVAG
jgi:chromosome segregation ATPase